MLSLECVEVVNKASAKVVGPARSGLPQRTMGAEDFSYFMQAVPGCFAFVGAGLPGDVRPHHKSVFDFDEDAMLVSCSILVQIVRETLQQE
jgi:amidohydrolase